MFDANADQLKSINIERIFRNSLREVPVKLATIPPFLVLVAPRHGHAQRSYRYIVPDRQIRFDNDMIQFVCRQCGKTNDRQGASDEFLSCDICCSEDSVSPNSSPIDAAIRCYCRKCLEILHKSPDRKQLYNHKLKKIEADKYSLDLFAVLCIETSHYVAFVKCPKTNGEHEWLFFDSMSDRTNDDKNIPCVSKVPDFDPWIKETENQRFFNDLDRRRNAFGSTAQKFSDVEIRMIRLFRDGAFFFYRNPNATSQ